jgi:C4-dicarboxylate transporter DctM subunit
LSTGALAAGGTLGIMIPPSVPLVIYAILTQESIGKLFMAAVHARALSPCSATCW